MANPKPQQTDEAILKARRARGDSAGGSPGSVVGAESGWRYTYFVVRDYPTDGRQVAAIRKNLADRGYEPRNGPAFKGDAGLEFVVGEPDAEIWRTSEAIAADEWKDEFLAALRNVNWFENQRRRENHGIAKRVLALAEALHRAQGTARNEADAALEAYVRNTPVLGLQVQYG